MTFHTKNILFLFIQITQQRNTLRWWKYLPFLLVCLLIDYSYQFYVVQITLFLSLSLLLCVKRESVQPRKSCCSHLYACQMCEIGNLNRYKSKCANNRCIFFFCCFFCFFVRWCLWIWRILCAHYDSFYFISFHLNVCECISTNQPKTLNTRRQLKSKIDAKLTRKKIVVCDRATLGYSYLRRIFYIKTRSCSMLIFFSLHLHYIYIYVVVVAVVVVVASHTENELFTAYRQIDISILSADCLTWTTFTIRQLLLLYFKLQLNESFVWCSFVVVVSFFFS